MTKWTDHVMYQIYPFGLLNALHGPARNIKELEKWASHLEKLNVSALYLSPILESDYHGYDTCNFGEIDHRIGNNEDFKHVVEAFHKHNVQVILDGVFNHVGRGFWAFKDVQQYRENSYNRSWFNIDFNGDSPYHDGFWYEGWEGHYELVKLNLKNPEVVNHILGNVGFWMDYYGIDGLRLDVAYMLDRDFMRTLRQFVKSKNPNFCLIGETIHGDYNQIVNDDLLDSCTNYECFKGLYSSFNDKNFFEIGHSLNRQFGPEQWTLYKGKHLLNFVDNHDVSRVASLLKDKKDLPLIYGMLFSMPGIPCLYYGSEWGYEAMKVHGTDDNLRPAFEQPEWNSLTDDIAKYAKIHREHPALIHGDYYNFHLNNQQIVFRRRCQEEEMLVCINMNTETYRVPVGLEGTYENIETKEKCFGNITLQPKSIIFLKKI